MVLCRWVVELVVNQERRKRVERKTIFFLKRQEDITWKACGKWRTHVLSVLGLITNGGVSRVDEDKHWTQASRCGGSCLFQRQLWIVMLDLHRAPGLFCRDDLSIIVEGGPQHM